MNSKTLDDERFYEEQMHKATNRAECLRLQKEELLYNYFDNGFQRNLYGDDCFPNFEKIKKEFPDYSLSEIQDCYNNYFKEIYEKEN